MKTILKKKAIFWDYDIKKVNLKNPKVKIWYLSRQFNFGCLPDISKNDLKKYLPKLQIDRSLKKLLTNYLKADA